MATGGYYEPNYGYPEVQIRMKVDIFTEGPTAGLTFNQTVNAPPPDGVYPGNFAVSYPQNSAIVSANPDTSRMLPWREEAGSGSETKENGDRKEEQNIRYRKQEAGKEGKLTMKDKNRPRHSSSGSLDSKKSASQKSESIQAENNFGKIPRAKPRRRSREEAPITGKDLDTTPDTEKSFDDLNPPNRPRILPGSVPVLPVSLLPPSSERPVLRKREDTQLVPKKLEEKGRPPSPSLEVVPQDVLINTFEDQTVQQERTTTRTSQALNFPGGHTRVPVGDRFEGPARQNPRVVRAIEETVTTTQLRYEQYRASLSARKPPTAQTAPPPQPKPKMVSAAVQTPKQRVSFDNTPPIPIERSRNSTILSESSSSEQSSQTNSHFQFNQQQRAIPAPAIPLMEAPPVRKLVPKVTLVEKKPNHGVETTIDDPGVVAEATQTEIPPQPKPRRIYHAPNPHTTETLIDDPGVIFLPLPPPPTHEEIETTFNEPGVSTEGIQTDFQEEIPDFFTQETYQPVITYPPPPPPPDYGDPEPDRYGNSNYYAGLTLQPVPEASESSAMSSPIPPPSTTIPIIEEPVQDRSYHSSAELDSSKDSTSYADYVVQHRLMPSAKIFEMYTRGTSPSIGSRASKSPTRSGKSSPSNFLSDGAQSQPNLDRSEEISDNSIDDERGSVSGPLSKKRQYAIRETKTIEETVEQYAEDGTSTVKSETRTETTVTSPTSTLTSVGRPKSRDNTLLKHALVKTNPALKVPSSRNSIDSERSSLSGVMKSGGSYNYRDMGSSLGSGAEENLSDYLQGDGMSPMVGSKNLGNYADSVVTSDSVISDASLKADRSHEIYDKGPLSSKERSFAEIMGLDRAVRSQEYNPDTKSGIAEARKDFFSNQAGSSSTSVSSYGSFRQDPIHQATVMQRPSFEPSGAVYGHAKPGTIKSQNQVPRNAKDFKKVSMSPTSL